MTPFINQEINPSLQINKKFLKARDLLYTCTYCPCENGILSREICYIGTRGQPDWENTIVHLNVSVYAWKQTFIYQPICRVNEPKLFPDTTISSHRPRTKIKEQQSSKSGRSQTKRSSQCFSVKLGWRSRIFTPNKWNQCSNRVPC